MVTRFVSVRSEIILSMSIPTLLAFVASTFRKIFAKHGFVVWIVHFAKSEVDLIFEMVLIVVLVYLFTVVAECDDCSLLLVCKKVERNKLSFISI